MRILHTSDWHLGRSEGVAAPGLDRSGVAGLGLVPCTVVPHTRPGFTVWVDWLTAHGVPHLALADGQAVVVDGDTQRVVGTDIGGLWPVGGAHLRLESESAPTETPD